MKTADKLTVFHRILATKRWKDDIYDIDHRYWLGIRKPKKADTLIEAHLRRVNGESSPSECDEVLKELIKR